MTGFSKYDVVVVRFPFASSIRYKARPAVVVSSQAYNNSPRETLLVMAISSQIDQILDFEAHVADWQGSGLLKPSILKASVATIQKNAVLHRLGSLGPRDRATLDRLIGVIC